MPVIQISTLELTDEQKMDIARRFTKILSESTLVPEERIYCLFHDFPLNSIAAGGHLVAESPPGPDDFRIKYTEELKKRRAVEQQLRARPEESIWPSPEKG